MFETVSFPINAAPITTFSLTDLLTNDDKEALSNVAFQTDNGNKNYSISESYTVLEDLNLVNIQNKFDSIIKFYIENILEIKLNMKRTGSWVTRLTNGSAHPVQSHANSTLSLAAYFSKDDLTKEFGIRFKVKGLASVFGSENIEVNLEKCINSNKFNSPFFMNTVTSDKVIVFPSYIKHSGAPSDDGTGYMLGANYFINDTLGTEFFKNKTTISVD